MRYPTMEETLRGFDYFFGQWGSGRPITLDQAIEKADAIKAARHPARREAERRDAEERAYREDRWEREDRYQREDEAWEEAERQWKARGYHSLSITTAGWRVVDDPTRHLLESGQVALRKATHDAAIERRLRELESGDGCILLLAAPVERVVEVRR